MRYQGMKATGPIQKQRMLEAYHIAVEQAFTEEIIQSAWKNSGIWPLEPSAVLEDPDLFPEPHTPTHETTTTAFEADEFGLRTPQNSRQLRDQLRALKTAHPKMPRDFYSIVMKSAKTIELLSVELATMRRDNFRLGAKLESRRPDKRQTVQKDPNKVFANVADIRSSQDKMQKRLRQMPHEDQVPIDSFLEMTPRTRKRARNILD
jgi:4-hydroxybenzoate polyprenyltransferase